jgi:hypothetical protein
MIHKELRFVYQASDRSQSQPARSQQVHAAQGLATFFRNFVDGVGQSCKLIAYPVCCGSEEANHNILLSARKFNIKSYWLIGRPLLS